MTHFVERVAHRGGSHLAPENTLAAFRNALTLPVDGIEVDVQMSRDGYAVIFHDNTVEGRTNGRGNLLDLDFAYLRSLNAAAHFPGGWPEPQQIPTLREVLELAQGHVRVYIEIKQSWRDGVYGRHAGIAEAVIEDVQALDMLDDVLIISFDWGILPHVRSLASGARTGALISKSVWEARGGQALEVLCEQVAALGCSWINMDCKLFTHDMPAVLYKCGLKLGLWTVNSEDEMRRFAATGVDSLTTDRPDLFAVVEM